MTVKAIALDIDGTLTNDKKVITPATKAALLRAQEGGIRLILASGRPAQGLHRLAEELELPAHNGLLVSFNGAHVSDAATGETYYDQPMDPAVMCELVDHLHKFDVIVWTNEGDALYLEDAYRCDIRHKGEKVNIVKYERDMCDLVIREVRDLKEVCKTPKDKILTAGDDTYLKEHWEEMYAPFRDRLAGMFTADFYFEFMAPGINKATALAGALPKLGIEAADVVAFGDAQNDARMLAWAGCGVAMGNAVDETKAAANMVTLDNNSDGIAAALEKILG